MLDLLCHPLGAVSGFSSASLDCRYHDSLSLAVEASQILRMAVHVHAVVRDRVHYRVAADYGVRRLRDFEGMLQDSFAGAQTLDTG